MGSKGRFPPHHLRHPLPGPGIGHHDSIVPEMHPQHGGFPPFDMLPHPEVMEQKLAAQHVEMQKLATENQRFAATHGTLRQDLAAIQHELQMLHNHVGAVKSEREQQIMGLLDKLGKMEADLQGAEPLKLELHQARADAQNLLRARDELASRVQHLTEDHQRVHMDLQQIPALISELESLRQEYQHCSATYEYEKKVYNDHLESLQVMEKNYMNMASEVEKLRAELKKHAEADRRTAGPYDKEASGHFPVGHNTFDNAYGVPQGHGPPLPGGSGGGAAAADGNTPVGATGMRGGYDAYRGAAPGYDMQRGGPPYDQQRGAYDAQRGPNTNTPGIDMQRYRGPGYNAYRGPGGFEGPRGPAYDMQRGGSAYRGSNSDAQRGPKYDGRGPGYDPHRGTSFESPKGPSGAQAQAQAGNVLYGSAAHGFQGAPTYPGRR